MGNRYFTPIFVLNGPLNGSSWDPGWINFTWTSLGMDFPINFTLQFSNSSEFSDIILEINNIGESVVITSHTIYLNMSQGTYYWRVRPRSGLFYGPWSKNYVLIMNEVQSHPQEDPPGLDWIWIIAFIVCGITFAVIILEYKIWLKKQRSNAKAPPKTSVLSQTFPFVLFQL